LAAGTTARLAKNILQPFPRFPSSPLEGIGARTASQCLLNHTSPGTQEIERGKGKGEGNEVIQPPSRAHIGILRRYIGRRGAHS
jgi:hypothetical protein